MKHLILVCALSIGLQNFAIAKGNAPVSRKIASVANSQQAAEQIIKNLYGRKNDPIRTRSLSANSYEVTIGDGTAANGAAIYRVDFKKLNLNGASSENEQVADIQVTYVTGN